MIAEREPLTFVGSDPLEQYRAKTLLTKETGTIQWLQENVHQGDIVWDIGANIGCYTLLAAQLVGERGKVYAFEPHIPNATSLLQNVQANGLTSRVVLVTCALDGFDGSTFRRFNYASLRPGSSGSQLGHTRGQDGQSFEAIATEMKAAFTMPALVSAGLQAPDLVKIDVDGNELAILCGMASLQTYWRPRSIQVEVQPNDVDGLAQWSAECGYELERIHYTLNGQKQLQSGVERALVVHNAIYRLKV